MDVKGSASVIGAGSSGLLFAKRAAELGVGVRVYDQRKVLGHPVRASGILSISGLDSLGIEYKHIVSNTIYGAKIYAGNEVMTIRSGKPQAHVLNRLRLNELLAQKCTDLGVEIERGRKINAEQLDRLSDSGIVVGADGFNSGVARHFGMVSAGTHVLTYREVYFTDDVEELDMVELFFDNRICKGFFGWIAPESKRTIEIGIGIGPEHGNSKEAMNRFKRIGRVMEVLKKCRFVDGGASVIPLSLRDRFTDDDKRVLLVGDAAGHVKPTTGGGIIFGGSGAVMAAEAVKNYFDGNGRISDYERMWRKQFSLDMKLHSVIRKVYASLGPAQLSYLVKAAKLLGAESFFSEKGDMDRPSVMLKRLFANKA